MKKATKRFRKKYLSRAAKSITTGKISRFHILRAKNEINLMFDRGYLNVFRPWWYDQSDRWNELDFRVEYKKHALATAAEIENKTRINLKKLQEDYDRLPKHPPRIRKYREPKPQPIRKLKNPEEFKIIVLENGVKKVLSVIGEKVFVVRGYDFFIRHDGTFWVVSDVKTGAAVSKSVGYKDAVAVAKKRIEENFDQYLKILEKFAG
ncbi:hypothetical protein PC41400_21675 [Paenibacillus chitinolyticus]|uniref:Uncharacterized protein n=1 Tax=Paenibacillus chitinolyticus TaxID=79263 RepID=A0A410X0Z1_9BACL|nr:hypothetical protein [Paenibacillus chitinolyticus]MCY9593743.1 hypothetical protein [Paenibacillus chitinolyticus]MCY9599692.1 hypothetical protein [Paenibacillus chitinolyticus]QAV20132.1 hypothetical protein PC41400_21675 [Paenibacillus chitinolyticus]